MTSPPPKPLSGQYLLNTRDAESGRDLTLRLEALGAKVLEQPLLAFAPPQSWAPFDQAATFLKAGQLDWVVFTSANAVRFSLNRLAETGTPRETFPALFSKVNGGGKEKKEVKVACVGRASGEALEAEGIKVALVPENFQGEGLLEAMTPHINPEDKIWMPRAEIARDVLPKGLNALGAKVIITPVYRTILPPEGLGKAAEALAQNQLGWIMFTSPSCVRHFMEALQGTAREKVLANWPKVVCVGRITAAEAEKLGVPVTLIPEQQDTKGMVDALTRWAEQQPKPSGKQA